MDSGRRTGKYPDLGAKSTYENGIEAEDGLLAVLRVASARIWRAKKGLSVWLILCLAVAAFYARSIPPSYSAAASLMLEARRQSSPASNQDTSVAVTLDAPLAESQLEVIHSERLLSLVFDGLKLASLPELAPRPPSLVSRLVGTVAFWTGGRTAKPADPDEQRQLAFANFRDRVGVRRVGQSYVVEVSYSSSDPTLARRVANSVASAYLAQSLVFKADAARNGADFLQTRVTALANEAKAASAAVADGEIPASPTPDADARIISAALQPLGPAAPRVGLIILFGGALGAMASFLFIAIRDALDRRIHSSADLRVLNVRCLGTIPELTRRNKLRRRIEAEMGAMVLQQPASDFARAMRTLRASISLATVPDRGGHGVVALTSWTSGAGCTVLCANLAHMTQSSGHVVTLIDADVHRLTGGLTAQASAADVSLSEVLVKQAKASDIDVTRVGDISVIPARSRDTRMVNDVYLGAPEMSEVIELHRSQGEVIVDVPPLSITGDARIAAAHADSVALVVWAGRTTRDEVVHALEALSEARANVIGVVLNRSMA